MIPNATKRKYYQGSIDHENDPIKALLLNENVGFEPNPVEHEFVSDVVDDGEEYDDENYERIDVEGTEVTQNDDENRAEWDANDLLWEDLGSSKIEQSGMPTIYSGKTLALQSVK